MNRYDRIKNVIKEVVYGIAHLAKLLWGEVKKLFDKFLEKQRLSIAFKITVVHVNGIMSSLIFLELLIIAGLIAYSNFSIQGQLNRGFNIALEYIKESKEIPSEKLLKLGELNNLSITIFDENKKKLFCTEKVPLEFLDKNYPGYIDTLKGNYILGRSLDSYYYDWKYNFTSNKYNFGYMMGINKVYKMKDRSIYIQIQTKMINEFLSIIVLIEGFLVINIFFLIRTIVSSSGSSKKILKPIHAMTDIVENITINEIDTRLEVSGVKDELKDLAKTFNGMLDRIQGSYEQQEQFVSDASHELRTPISVIQGYANLLDRWGKNDEQVLLESIEAIKTETESMKILVEQLLFLARGDKDTQRVEMKDFNLNELIDRTIKDFKLINNTHEIICDRNDIIMINGDPNLIKEALRIFVDNGIKYTQEGGSIRVNSYRNNSNVIITIEDNGVGISKEDLPRIFDRFYRADKSRTRNTGGTGLGLSIAKWIIQKHNGKIEVNSEVNKGTTITIKLTAI